MLFTPHEAALVAWMMFTAGQFSMCMFHYLSYVSTPQLLRSPKPLVMRDFFLTRCGATFPSLLSVFYCDSSWQATWRSAVVAVVGYPLMREIGVGTVALLWAAGGVTTAAVYLAQMQLLDSRKPPVSSLSSETSRRSERENSRRGSSSFARSTWNVLIPRVPAKSTPYDCGHAGTGAVVAVCTAAALGFPKLPALGTKSLRIGYPAAGCVAWCLQKEYWREHRPRQGVEVRDWGSLGGVLAGVLYAFVIRRTRADWAMVASAMKKVDSLKKDS